MRKLIASVVVCFVLSGAAGAATVTVGTDQGLVSPGRDNQGWWSDVVTNSNPTNDNYFTGDSGGGSLRSYFTFDLSGIAPNSITGLKLELRRYEQSAQVELGFWDVTTSAVDLAQRFVNDLSIFDDLGSGVSFGSAIVATGDSTDVLSFGLNANAVSAANMATGGYFSIGVSLIALNPDDWIFSNSSLEPGNNGPGFTQQLVITTGPTVAPIPLPASVLLLTAALGAFGLVRRRRTA